MNTRYILLVGCCAFLSLTGKAQTYSLTDCEKMAIENNYQIKNSKLQMKAALETRKEAFTSYFPTVSGTGAYYNANQGLLKSSIETQQIVSPELASVLSPELLGALPASMSLSLLKNGTVAGVTAVQPVFAGGRIIHGNKLAKIGEEVAQLQLELTEDEVILTTHSYYWQVVNLMEKLETITAVEKMLTNLLKDVEIAVKAGLTTRNDLLRVELQMKDVESNRLKVENGLSVSKMQLAQFIGADIDGLDIEYNNSSDYQDPIVFYRHTESAVMNRAETRLFDQDIHAAKLRTKIALGEQLPTVGVGGGYLYNNLLNNSNNSGVIFASVSIPISGWWEGSHSQRRHKFIEQQAVNNKNNNIELMTVETNQVWNDLVESHKQILLAESAIQSSSENLRIVNNSYKAGIIPLTELLDAQVLFQQSKNSYSDAYSVYQIRLLKYRQITKN